MHLTRPSLITLLLVALAPGHAQTRIVPPSSSTAASPSVSAAPYQAPELPDPGTRLLSNSAYEASETAAAAAAGTLAFLNPSVVYSLQYSDSAPSSFGVRNKTFIHRLSPAVRATFAERWALSYRPSLIWYSNNAFTDRVNHAASLQGSGVVGAVDLALSQSYSRSAEALIETGEETKQEIWGTSLAGSMSVGDKTSLEATGGQQIRHSPRYTDTKSWSGSVRLHYEISPRLDLSAGAGASYTAIDPGADLTSQQFDLGARWVPGSRINLSANVGADRSRFRLDGAEARARPTVNLNVGYALTSTTQLSFSASRSRSLSYFSNQYADSQRISLGLSQQLLGRLSLNLRVSENDSDYVGATTGGIIPNRSDRYRTYSASLGTQLLGRFSTSLSWQYNQNRSTRLGYRLESTVVGATISWRY